ncbi:unannotated protein [freshwater metagenome]|uniref:Unannotated protein n=1 Tax=freshwater metagenome TaxID=449393 RepID=A0A6J6VAZ8_9ZZZZ
MGTRHLRRCFDLMDQSLIAGARQGWVGVVGARGYSAKFAPHRAHTYATDSSPMNLLVLDKRGGQVIDLHETHVIDEATRFVLVLATTDGAPDTSTTVAVLGAAVAGYRTDDGTFVGGVPDRVLSDNGAEYKGKAVTSGLVRLGFLRKISPTEAKASGLDDTTGSGNTDDSQADHGDDGHEGGPSAKKTFTNPESGFENGISESFHITFQEGFSADLPGFVNPRWPKFQQLKQRDYWKANAHLLLTREQVDMLLQKWLMHYNFAHSHSGIGGQTPFEAWCSDEHPLHEVDPNAIALAMLNDVTAVVDRGRIKALRSQYYAPELAEFHGRTVEVRYLPGRLETVTVFVNGHKVCEAVRRDHLTAGDSARIKDKRTKQTQAHLAHTAAGERLKAERARRELLDQGFTEEELPSLPSPAPIEQAAAKRTERQAAKQPRKTATPSEREALAALLAAHPDEEYLA